MTTEQTDYLERLASRGIGRAKVWGGVGTVTYWLFLIVLLFLIGATLWGWPVSDPWHPTHW